MRETIRQIDFRVFMFRFLTWLMVVLNSAAYAAGSADCAPCHRAIYERYQTTPMARSAGAVGHDPPPENFTRSRFTHAASGFRYGVSREGERYTMEFAKAADGDLRGKKALAWYIGSGATARSYALSVDGFLFEAPVAYYTLGAKWDLAPAYDRYAYPYLTRPIVPGCLTCHASFLKPVAGTQNRFADPPFAEGGVACERCHGPGEAHIAKMRAGKPTGGAAILNPVRLDPDRRDSVCAQCHLSGEVRVMRPKSDWQSYRPGDRLSDSVTVFVSAGAQPGMTVTGHVEKLAQSACKRVAGARLWCGSCHDPHSVPKPSESAAWFRRKCMNCHETRACTESPAARARRADDCAGCHLPKSPVTDAQHVVYTDHSIPRRPRTGVAPRTDAELVVFGGGKASARDTALAYAIAAGRRRTPAAESQARRLLEAVERESPDDSEVLLYLAEIYRNAGLGDRAIPLYRRSMEFDPAQVTGPVGLGGILFERGDYREAIRLWQDALAKNPGLVLVGTNTAMAHWLVGERKPAEEMLRSLIDLSPGFAVARDLLRRLEGSTR